jgi:hypothetical protein
MDIKLFIDDKEKTFVLPFVKGRMLRRVLEIFKDYDFDHITPETLDVIVDFVVECFGGQFSRDEFYDGIQAEKLMDTLLDFINKISGTGLNISQFPNVKKN